MKCHTLRGEWVTNKLLETNKERLGPELNNPLHLLYKFITVNIAYYLLLNTHAQA